MTAEELTVWRTYAAAALQGLVATNPKARAEGRLLDLCSQSASIADLMMVEEIKWLERNGLSDKNRPSITPTEREIENAELLKEICITQDTEDEE